MSEALRSPTAAVGKEQAIEAAADNGSQNENHNNNNNKNNNNNNKINKNEINKNENNNNNNNGEETDASSTAGLSPAAIPEESGRPILVDPTRDLWSNIALNVKDSSPDTAEVALLVVGGCGSGKTSLLQRIYAAAGNNNNHNNNNNNNNNLNNMKNKKVKPTTALDYSFARRSDRNFSQVAHFWELGQNQQLSSLADIILAPDGIHAVVCAVVVDFFSTEGLSSTMASGGGGGGGHKNENKNENKYENKNETNGGGGKAGLGDGGFNVPAAWDTAVYWLKRIDARSAEVLEKMRAKNSSTPAKLLSRAQKLCGGAANPDLTRMRLSGLPTVLVVNKMDLFFKHVYHHGGTNYKKEEFTLLVRAFRFLAHLYGCYLVFTAAAPESGGAGKTDGAAAALYSAESTSKWRNVMSHLLFQTPFESKYVNFDLEKDKGAVLVTAEKDSFVDIGEPTTGLSTSSGGKGGRNGEDGPYSTAGDAELERWRASLEAVFPPPADNTRQLQQQRQQHPSATSPTGASAQEFTKLLYDTYAEAAIDAMRRQKDEELEQYRKTARLKAKETA